MIGVDQEPSADRQPPEQHLVAHAIPRRQGNLALPAMRAKDKLGPDDVPPLPSTTGIAHLAAIRDWTRALHRRRMVGVAAECAKSDPVLSPLFERFDVDRMKG